MDRFGDVAEETLLVLTLGHLMNGNSSGAPLLISDLNVSSCPLLSQDMRMNGECNHFLANDSADSSPKPHGMNGRRPSCLCREEPLVQTLTAFTNDPFLLTDFTLLI